MKQSYWTNDLYDVELVSGTASSAHYNMVFKRPITVSELIAVLDLIKAEEVNKRDYSRGDVYIHSLENPIVEIHENEDIKLPTYEKYKDLTIKKAILIVEWCVFTFMLEI